MVTNHHDSLLQSPSYTARGFVETVNWNLKGAKFAKNILKLCAMGLEVMAHVATTGDVCQIHQCLVFKPFLLDLRDERLWKGDEAIRIGAKAFAVLRCLLMQAGQLVTKEALLETVSPETVVGEAVLPVVIRELRQALGDQAQKPQFIETVRGRGYRFIAPVTMAQKPSTYEAREYTARHSSPPSPRLRSSSGARPKLRRYTNGSRRHSRENDR